MSTSEPPAGVPLAPEELTVGERLAGELSRLANQLFQAPPSPPSGLGPSSLSVGAGGVGPSQNGPPLPGFLHRPPLASAPLPKETDLRTLPSTFSDAVHGPAAPALLDTAALDLPLGLVVAQPHGATPYFLDLAGVPSVAPVPSAPAPGAPAVPTAGPAPATAPSPSLAAPPAPESLPAATPPLDLPSAGAVPFVDFLSLEPVPAPRATPGIFDPYAVKRDFPILLERVHGRPLVWLDNAATTQKPRAVIERLSTFYERENSNVHRAAHALAARATDAYEGAREKVRRFLNAPSTKDVVFARGTTEAINLVAQSWGRRNVGPGDEIVITWLEHHANIVPWQQLATEKGARLRVAPVDDRGEVILDELERLLGPRTRIVSVSQVSNALGTIVPVKEIVQMGHRHGARVLVDGAQAVSHLSVDVQALDCDFYVFSGHKIFGPTGIGALYGKSDVLESMPPWQGGGNMIQDVRFERTVYQAPPWKFEAGTGNIADAVGLGAALDYVTAIGLETIGRYEHELLEYATGELTRIPGLQLIGTAPDKAGVLSFVLDGIRTEDIGAALDQEGIAVRSGHHCAQPILRRYGLESTVRASLALYNTHEDVDALVAALRRLQAGR